MKNNPVINEGIKKEGSHPRVKVIDALRGLSIILMVLHHFAVDLIMYGLLPGWLLDNLPFHIVQSLFAGVFITISGLSSYVSRHNLKRGLQILAGGMAVTIVTLLFSPEYCVRFGILHFLGCAALIYSLAGKAFNRLPRGVSLALLITGFALSVAFTPAVVENPWLFPLNLLRKDFVSGDFFPILPWIFVYFFGAWLAKPVFEGKFPEKFYGLSFPFLEKVGQKTFLIYLLHQPVLMGLTMLINLFLGGA